MLKIDRILFCIKINLIKNHHFKIYDVKNVSKYVKNQQGRTDFLVTNIVMVTGAELYNFNQNVLTQIIEQLRS